MSESTIGEYKVFLKNQAGEVVALFDSFLSLQYSNGLNDIGSYSLAISGADERVSLFELDGQIEIYRRVPNLSRLWYKDFEGFHRKSVYGMDSSGFSTYTSSGLSYNSLLARTAIAFKEGTIRSEKSANAETVMKEYVLENCTEFADDMTVVGRLNYDEHLNDDAGGLVYTAQLPGFSVDPNNSQGPLWSGERAYENLLTTLQDIAAVTGVDFAVVGDGPAKFKFVTYVNGMGQDRSYDVIDDNGRNSHGNVPVVFSPERQTVKSISYTEDAIPEVTAVIVLGKGELSLREAYTVTEITRITASPWNRIETTRTGSNAEYDYQFRQNGYEELANKKVVKLMEFDPLQSDTQCLNLHFGLGDRVTAVCGPHTVHNKIVKVSVQVKGTEETITMETSNLF